MRTASVRTELLIHLGVLAAAALLFGVAGVVALAGVAPPELLGRYAVALVAADVVVFLAVTAFHVRRLVLQPLAEAVAATEAIAAGDLARRVPGGSSRELQALAHSVNRMTDRLLDERAQLVRAEKLAGVGRLAAGVAHEIGNPLGAITGYAHVLRSRPGDPEVIGGIEREAARMDRIVRGLLDYARPRSATPAPVDVSDVVRGALRLLADQGRLREIDVRESLAADAIVRGQRHDLEQLFVNLLLNAADAMDGRGALAVHTDVRPRAALERPSTRRTLDSGVDPVLHEPSARAAAWLRDTPARQVVSVVVADSGAGVPEQLRERIFDPFFTTKDPGSGTGLGLAIAARVVENFGGTIWVTAAREGGAAFHMLFPADAVAALR